MNSQRRIDRQVSSTLRRHRTKAELRKRARRFLQRGFEQLESRAMMALTINFQYAKNTPGVGFDNANTTLVNTRMAALTSAAQTFGNWFSQTATLTVEVQDYHSSPLGSDGDPAYFFTNTNPGFALSVPEQIVINGTDPNGAGVDGFIYIDWEEGNPDPGPASWDYDDSIAAGNLDFKAQMLHNLAHVLGFQTVISSLGEDIFRDPFIHPPGDPGTWATYDRFLTDTTSNPTPLIDPANFKLNLTRWMNANSAGTTPTTGLFFNGTNANAANGGSPVPLHSPSPVAEFALASHTRASGTVTRQNSLMVPHIDASGNQILGPLARNFSAVEIGIMRDLGYQIDTTAPTVALSTSATSPRNTTAAFSVMATISEPIAPALVAGNITVTNATVSNIVKVGNNFTFDVTPSIANGTVSLVIPANAIADVAGNRNAASNTLTIVLDTTRPAPAMTSSPASPTTAANVTVTVDLGESLDPSFLLNPPVNVTGGTATNFSFVTLNSKPNSGFTFLLNPTTTPSTVTVSVLANAVADLAGNKNTASASPLSVVFNAPSPSRIAGIVYEDADIDGTKDTGERTLGGIPVHLTGTAGGQPVDRVSLTLADGTYHFDNLAVGDYTVNFTRPTLYVDASGANDIGINISAPGTNATDRNFAVLGNQPGYASLLETLSTTYYLTDPSLRTTGLFAVLGSDGAMNSFRVLDGYSGILFAEVAVSSDGRQLSLTVVTDTHEVKTARLYRGQFVRVSTLDGGSIVRVFGGVSHHEFTSISLANPPVTSVPKYLDSIRAIFAQEGWGTVAPNPSTSIAPEILISRDGQVIEPLFVTASGGTNAFDVALNAPPASGVVVLNVVPVDSTHVQVNGPSTLTFNSTNWNVPQMVTVQGKSDGTPAIENHQTNIRIAVKTPETTAANYAHALPQEVSVTTIDNVGFGTIVATGTTPTGAALAIAGNVIPLPPGLGNAAGVTVAMGDVNDDGVADYVLGSGTGVPPQVVIVNGVTGQAIGSFLAYSNNFLGGVRVATGDVNGDGVVDIITGAGPGGGPHVKVFDGRNRATILSFLAFNPSFTGGVNVAAGDVDGDGTADVIVGAGSGAGPHVKVFSGETGALLQSFFAYESSFTGGVFVAAGDLDGDGKADIVAGQGAGGLSQVKAFNGLNLATIASFLPFSGFTGGVRVAVDLRTQTIIAGMGPGGSEIRTFSNTGQLQSTITPFGSSTAGVQVAVTNTVAEVRAPLPTIRPVNNLPSDPVPDAVPGTRFVTNTTNNLPIEVDFGGAVTGFAQNDLQVTGATIASGTFREVSPGRFTFTLVPLSGLTGVATINILAGAAQGPGNIPSLALAVPLTIRFDRVLPTPNIELPLRSNALAEPVRIQFAEPVPGNFDVTKLVATNGTVSNVARTGESSFAFTLTPTTRGQVTVVFVQPGFVRDVAGNLNLLGHPLITFAPFPSPALIPVLSSTEQNSTTLSPIPFSVDFGTAVNGFSASTPQVTNGTVGGVTNLGNGKFSFTVTPSAAGPVSVTIPADTVTDAANSSRKNVASETLTVQYHSDAPRPEISSLGLTSGGMSTRDFIPFEVIFSAPVDDFTAEDIRIVGGNITGFDGAPSQPLYRFLVATNGTGEISLSIPAAAAKDVNQLDSLESTPFTFQSEPVGDALISVRSGTSSAIPGAEINYSVIVRNISVGTVLNVVATATLPADLTFVPDTTSLADSRISNSGQNVTINVGTLLAHDVLRFVVKTRLKSGVAAGTIETVTFTMTGTNDVSAFNNINSNQITVLPGSFSPGSSATVTDVQFGGTVRVEVPAGSGATITNLVSTPITSLGQAGQAATAALPVGVNIAATSFQINNAPANSGEIVVTLYPPGGVPLNSIFTKYGKRPGESIPTIYNFMYDATTGLGAQMFPDRIEIHLKDGKLGDDDGVVNGVIVDPGFMTSLNPVAPYQSLTNPLDVDDDTFIAPIDALIIINVLNSVGSYALPSVVPMPMEKFPFLDTDGDGFVAPIDALLVINLLNNPVGGEGEPSTSDIAPPQSAAPLTAVPQSALATSSAATSPINLPTLPLTDQTVQAHVAATDLIFATTGSPPATTNPVAAKPFPMRSAGFDPSVGLAPASSSLTNADSQALQAKMKRRADCLITLACDELFTALGE